MRDDIGTRGPPSISASRAKEILKARALELARPLKGEQAASQSLEIIEFRLAQERFAVDRAHVREVFPLKDLTPLPCTPPFVLGIISVRGQILPVIDIKKFFDLPEAGITDTHVVVIVHAGDVELGILADVVTGGRSIPLDSLQPTLPTLTGIRARYLKGVTDQHVVVLEVSRILGDPKILVNEEVSA